MGTGSNSAEPLENLTCDPRPCPFCGGNATEYVSHGKYGDFGYIKCDGCDARSGTKKLSRRYSADEWESGEVFNDIAYDNVRTRWNRRVVVNA